MQNYFNAEKQIYSSEKMRKTAAKTALSRRNGTRNAQAVEQLKIDRGYFELPPGIYHLHDGRAVKVIARNTTDGSNIARKTVRIFWPKGTKPNPELPIGIWREKKSIETTESEK